MKEFLNEIVLITGGSKGIGAAAAERFCQEGAHCIIVSRHLKECQAYAESLRNNGYSASSFVCDVSKISEIKNMVTSIIDQFGKIDVLVNSAGVNIRKYGVEYSEDEWDYIININLKGAYFCAVEVGKQMIKQKKGAIVSLASIQSHINLPRLSIYGVSKAGIRQFTKGLGNEWATLGVRVNCVSPAFITTPLVENVLKSPDWLKIINSRTPMGRPGTPTEVADAILFLASDKASYITGTDLAVDGGWIGG
ncbi:SDR family NAD(P)-dependent oxidoreductase [Megasphaera paucivorans]|uniref:2-deoxy-D-gluconate 3-dehydrogenase n=1 Tax=Megasphaera paucivorans TaxID=349095 RepID=A0A1H0BIU4_9FIRM|nr:SDR family oxidoreductase [Megasphaera paucivorans]SDN45569.1 2-deoxy-D-gluconate 3-dehydrogenase [Megasphaera paucivorans]